jgi:cytochrome c-type biogenesis protein
MIATRHSSRRHLLFAGGVVLLAAVVLSVRATSGSESSIGGGSLLVLAPAAFLAGLLSFLSPCCLPVLSAYVAYSAQVRQERLVATTTAFFAGVATTIVVLGATATALSQLLFRYLPELTTFGGLLIIGFGVMSLLGKGFGGIHLGGGPGTGALGAYLYGATFALGWTACVGPILGALLTLLATQGLAVLQGALLAFIYALGLGAPLIALASFLSRRDRHARLWQLLRGRGFTLRLMGRELYLHTAGIMSGLLLIVIGLFLATGQLAVFSQWAVRTPVTQWVLEAEEALRALLFGR